jgi:enolase
MVPSGASTGAYEAIELRDGDTSRWLGKGVDNAVNNVVESIQEALVGMPVDDQKAIDEVMIELDGTPNKANLGANSMLGVSMACLHAGAALHELPLWRYIGGVAGGLMPVPMLNILNGGAHAASNVDVQEFMVMPHGFDTFPEALRAGVECYHSLKKELKADGLLGGVGDEGGFAPNLPANEAGLGYMVRAIEGAGYSTEEIGIALDVASTEFYKDGAYHMDGKVISGEDLSDMYATWVDEYPLLSIEDGFAEDDWRSWSHCMRDIGDKVQLVGDDLFVTQTERLSMGIESKAANAILVKVNQVGTITETLETMDMASAHGMNSVVSHRSGETEDTTIADLAVGTRAGQIKTGAPARSDRVAKYNQLLRISDEVSEYRSPF